MTPTTMHIAGAEAERAGQVRGPQQVTIVGNSDL